MNLLDLTRIPGPPRRDVLVRVGGVRPPAVQAAGASVCVIGVAPEGWPWMNELLPRAIVRDTRYRVRGCAVEHLRLGSRDDLEVLPGLGNGGGSRILDAVRLALHAGLPSLDLLLARAPSAGPRDLGQDDVLEALEPLLADLPGAVLLYPDLAPTGPGAAGEDELVAWVDLTRALSAGWAERFQIALLDFPSPEVCAASWWPQLLGLDAALCSFNGTRAALAAHAWRCPSALLAAALATERAATGGTLVGHTLALAPGRGVPPSRVHQLEVEGREPHNQAGDPLAVLRLEPDRVRILSEPALRRPLGAWTLPCLRVVKIIHRRVIETCNRFVFETVDEGRATALSIAIQHALASYIESGLFVGPNQSGPPEVEGWPERGPDLPSLRVEISGWLRPWSRSLALRVSVRPGVAPELESS